MSEYDGRLPSYGFLRDTDHLKCRDFSIDSVNFNTCAPKQADPCPMMQVVLLDPVLYPGALKAFAKEICRNDLLNFGRLHFFFPDSRLALDLNTDKALKVMSTTKPPGRNSLG